MANKLFKKAFTKDFTGISGECSALEPDGGEVNRAVNYEYSVGNSLRGRVGIQPSGAHGFFAIFPYRYTRTQDQYDISYQVAAGVYPNQTPGLVTTKTVADGASIEKLIAINQQVWMLDTMNITITQVNAGTYTWYASPTASGIFLHIKKDGTEITGMPQSLGGGIFPTSIYTVLNLIDATSDLSVSRTTRGVCPPFAIVNGAQTTAGGASATYGTRYTVTVNAGHNFQAGDIITFNISSLTGGFVISTTATTITYVGPQVTLSNGAVLGYLGQDASNFPISTVSRETGGVFIMSFPYWRLIPEGDAYSSTPSYGGVFEGARGTWSGKTTNSFYAPPVAENLTGNLYVAASSLPANGSTTYSNNLIKLDGRQVSRAGLPTCSISAGANAAGALTGAYKYKIFLRRYDAQGNIIDGPVSSVGTYTAAAESIHITLSVTQYANITGFCLRGCYKHTTETPSGASFYVDDNSAVPGLTAFVQPGDVICLTDNTAQTPGLYTDNGLATVVGTLRRTICTAYTAQVATISPTISSIKVEDSSAFQINNNTEISTGLTAVILRTAAGANQYYVLGEVPVVGYAGLYNFYDNVPDSTLIAKEQYLEVTIGKEHNAPPACTLVCQHQGGLVVARGPTTPNTVSFSTVDGIEYFPTASNSFDIPSTQTGFITAIASDTIDRLAVFKDKAYYDVAGDLDGGNFSVNVRQEGDFGVSSQASLVRINNALIGVCKNGWVTIQDGFLDPYKFKDVSSRLINQAYQFNWAVAVNDYFNRQYICTIPQSGTGLEPVTYAIDYSRNQIITFERSYTKVAGTEGIQSPGGGMVMIGDTLYHLSSTSPYVVFRRLIRFNGDSPGVGDSDSFYDNAEAITYILESQPINFGEPGQYKSPIRLRIWSIPNDYVIEGWVPFSVLVETAASPLAQYIGTAGTNNTTSSVSFTADTDVNKDIKLVKQKCFFYIVRFTTSLIGTAPFITGYEIMFAENYEKEDFVK